MSAQPFSLAEQYAFTTGLCHVFAAAAHAQLGGQPTVLIATDPRQLAEHDYPADEPLPLHVFLTLPDGSVVDGEGRRSLDELLQGFGVRRGYTHELHPDPKFQWTKQHFGPLDKAWTAVVGEHLKEHGWTGDTVPQAVGALEPVAAFRKAREDWGNDGLGRYVEEVQRRSATLETAPSRRRRLNR